jgi:heme a synthase
VIGLRLTGAPASAVRTSQIVLTGLCVQAAIGYAQYFSHLPAGLVWVHVAMSAALWIFVLRLYLSTRKGRSVDNAEATAGHGYAATPAA